MPKILFPRLFRDGSNQIMLIRRLAIMVHGEGLEPSQLAPHGPQPCVSTIPPPVHNLWSVVCNMAHLAAFWPANSDLNRQ